MEHREKKNCKYEGNIKQRERKNCRNNERLVTGKKKKFQVKKLKHGIIGSMSPRGT